MPPGLSVEHKEAGSACRRGSVDEHKEAGFAYHPSSVLSIRRQPNEVSEMSPKLSVEHQEAGSACRRGSVLSIRRQASCTAGAR